MKTIEDIKRHLMLHGSFTKDIGLLDGKRVLLFSFLITLVLLTILFIQILHMI